MISLGMIVRNAEATLERCLESVAPHVDEIVIGLGGESTDNTEEIARRFTDKIIPIEWHDDFSEARNIVMRATTGEYYLWLDADDELVGGEHMRQLTEDHPEIEAFYWGYDYAHDEKSGATLCYLIRERLIKKSRRWRWRGEIHEVLEGPPNHERMLVSNILVKHHPQPREGTRNLDILRALLEKTEPNPDPRTLVYLGTENATKGNYSEALLHLQRYVKLSEWDEEKYQAQHRIADLYRAMGQLDRARQADFDAIAVRPDWPDAYLGLAETAFFQRRYHETVEWTKAAATKKTPETFLILNPRDYDYHPLIILGNAYAQLRDFEMASENFRKALAIIPDEKVLYNLRAMEEELAGHDLVDAFLKIWTHLAQNDEWLKARTLFDSVPKLIERVPPILEKDQFTRQVTAHVEYPDLMVKQYVENPHWQPMTDEILDGEWRHHPRLEFARKIARGSRLLLDLGASDGFISIPLVEEGVVKAVRGIDLDPRCVELANRRADERKLDAVYETGDLQSYELGHKADVALLFEVLEHVVDPNALLEQIEKSAKHIAITTPNLAWESPNPEWDKNQLKPHIRIFSREDIERMLGARGRILNLYHQPHEHTGWLFADYRPGERTNGHVTIIAPGTPEAWSPRTFEREGLGGSETALIGIGEGFAKLNRKVSIFSRIADEGYFNGVRYRDWSGYVPGIYSDLFIAWRAPELIDDQVNSPQAILWMHDTDVGDRLTPARAAKFTNIVVLTNWHKEHMLKVYPFLDPSKLIVIPNGVNLDLFNGPTRTRDKNRVVYSSSPDRGLDIILEHIWPKVIEAVPDAELHVYYGWNNFDQFIPVVPQLGELKSHLMDLLSKSKNVVQHGRVSQTKLAQEMRQSNIWLYPTSFTETYCITAVEAQLAGLHSITNNLAALAETVKSGVVLDVEEIQKDPQGAINLFIEATISALRYPNNDDYREFVKNNAPAVSWDEVAKQWDNHWMKEERMINGSRMGHHSKERYVGSRS